MGSLRLLWIYWHIRHRAVPLQGRPRRWKGLLRSVGVIAREPVGSVVRGLIPEVGRHLLEESLDEVCRKGLERLSDAWKVLFGYVCVHVDHEFAHSQDFAGLFFVKPRVVHPAFECCEEEM